MPDEPRAWRLEKLRLEREPPQHDDILRSIGEIVVAWNGLEASIRLLLEMLCGHSHTTKVLTSEMSAEQLSSTLRAISKLTEPAQIRGEIEFAGKKMDELRPYRNDYLHGIQYSGVSGDKLGARIKNQSAKGGVLRLHDQVFDAYDMFLVKESMEGLSAHTLELYFWLLLHRNKGTPSALPQRPAFPTLHSRNLRTVP